jgi:hypothetical protein
MVSWAARESVRGPARAADETRRASHVEVRLGHGRWIMECS